MRKSKTKNSGIRFVISDVDGVLTDGGLYYSNEGRSFKKFNAKDGFAFLRLKSEGFITGIVSSSPMVELLQSRATDLNVDFLYSGEKEKEVIVMEWLRRLDMDWSAVAYIGDDVPDLNLLRLCGLSACPSDAHPEVRKASDIVLRAAGGGGCFRELVDSQILN